MLVLSLRIAENILVLLARAWMELPLLFVARALVLRGFPSDSKLICLGAPKKRPPIAGRSGARTLSTCYRIQIAEALTRIYAKVGRPLLPETS
jgi:hypothetical protein